MQRLDVEEAFITVHTTRTDSYQRLPPAQRIIRQIRPTAIASSPSPKLFIACSTLVWGRGYTCSHSELRMRTLTAAKWRRVSSSQMKIWTAILVKLSVVSHNTQKGVVRRKLCRFSSKLSPEVLPFVSYACLKF